MEVYLILKTASRLKHVIWVLLFFFFFIGMIIDLSLLIELLLLYLIYDMVGMRFH